MKKPWLIAGGVGLIVLAGVTTWLLLARPAPTATAPAPAKKETATPKPVVTHTDTVLASMSLRDKVASLLVLHAAGTDPAALSQFMATYKAGGFILMGDNIPATDAALQAITAGLRGGDQQLPRLVSTDQEGGTVRRLMGDQFANAETLKHLPVAATSEAFSQRSAMVQAMGITLNFGIIADNTANPASFIYDRVLGTSPTLASERVAAAVTATKGKTLSTLKHFPGHGETIADSHSTIPTIPISKADWQARDEPPFKAGIDAGADVVMVGHLRYSAVDSVPATLSKKWHDILRNEVGFKGVVITDAMQMLQNSGDSAYADPLQNAIMALQAGNTMLLYVLGDGPAATDVDPNQLVDGITTAVQTGKIDSKIIDQDAKQALDLRAKTTSFIGR